MSNLSAQPRPARPPQTDDRPDEARGASDVVFAAFDGAVGHIRSTHLAIAARSFRLSGAGASPARLFHDGISKAVYGSIRGIGKVSGAVVGAAVGALGTVDRPISTTLRGAVVQGAINGWVGDRLVEQENDLAVEMSLRDPDGRLIEATPEALAAAYPDATPRLAIFIHGLTETERTWWLATGREDGGRGPTYGERLASELGYTPLYLRYNTGLRISTNGKLLDSFLEQVTASWPTTVGEIALFGFSMGGLVARSANQSAVLGEREWVGRVRHVFHIGTPHHGAPLERFTNAATRVLGKVPEAAAVGDLLNGRSGGVKDMRFGNLLDADWEGHDPDELLRDRRTSIPYLEHAHHYFLAATLARSPSHPVNRVFGDMLVLLPSAWAEGTHPPHRSRFANDRSRSYGGLTHFHLANHPAVYAQIREWLETPIRKLPATTA